MINFEGLDFSSFVDVPQPVRFYDQLRMTVSKKGRVYMNPAFLRQVGEARIFRFQMSPDGRWLLLRMEGSGNAQFSSQGCAVNKQLAEYLEETGVELPISYRFDWCEQADAWVGRGESLPAPPQLIELLPQKRERRRRGETQVV